MAMSLNDLTNSLRMDGYTARTDEALQQEAEKRVGETYSTMREAASQRQAIIEDAYECEMQALSDALAAGQQAVLGQANRANESIDDYVNTRSMQRTSYGAAAKGNVEANMLKAAALMQQQYETANAGVENQKVLLARQLGDTLAQYDKDYLTDVQAYIDAQKQLDYDRKVAADAEYNALQMQLFELGKAGSRSGGGRSYGGSSGSSKSSGALFANLASREVQKTYNLNPTFGSTNQTTKGGTLYNKNNTTAKKTTSSNTYVSPSGKTYKKS